MRATSGTGARAKTADQTITVTVTDVDGEAPGVPAAPTVSSASVSSLTAAWAAPANAGPPITDYDYRYQVKSTPGWTEVTNTTITALSATITGLAEDTEYEVQVRATNDEGTSGWSDPGSASTDANAAPAFTSSATFSAAENQTAAGTVEASDSDTGDSVTGYEIQGGADQSAFSIGAASGVLTFRSAPNFEDATDADASNTYEVVVRATSGTGARAKTADQTITVTVTDVDGEAPGVPAAPTVSSASVSSLTAAWAAPANAGPPITDYDYRYQVKSTPGWTEVTNTTSTALSATITGLAEDTEYEVQVRATNDEGTSGWSDPGSASTDANAAPAFTSSATFSAAENQTAAGTVEASDSDTGDSVTGYEIQGGADRSKFSIGAASGVLTFRSAPNFEDATDADASNTYEVVVRATSGTGARAKTADQTITVTVTDVDGEAPGVPAAPTVSSASVSSVTAAWAAPANAGPPITDYDYRYQVKSTAPGWTEVTNTTITALSATITGLAEDTEYEVQVRATNDEGTSGWSDPGSASTDANAAPAFTSSATFSAAENQTAAGTVEASDSDTGDSVTGYEIQGGADRSKFSIGAASGVLTFRSAPNFEDATDADASNTYEVVVRATSGTGARAKTEDQTITVTVTDVDGEAPGVPAAPTVSSASVSSVTAAWAAPANAGPPITDYDYRYRVKSTAPGWTEVTNTTITALSATITGLAEDTEYEVQVRATNDEGTSGWSDPGSASTHKVNGGAAATAPTVNDVAVTSTPASGTTYYLAGEVIEFTVTFSAPVTVTATPKFAFRLGAATRQAAYASGSESAALVFARTVQAGEVDRNGISWNSLALALDGGTITQTGATTAARLTHAEQASLEGHRVDAAPPMQVSASVQGLSLVLVYDEPLDPASMPATGAYTVTATVGATTTNPAVSEVSIYGIWVTLALDAAPAAGATVTLAYAPPASNPVQDEAGNDAPTFSGQSLRLGPPPPPDLKQVMGVGATVGGDPGNAQLVVTWTAVDNATGYTVQWTSSGQGYNTGDRQATVTTGSTTRYTIPSLTNGTEYTVRVIATRTGADDGPPSDEMTGTPRVPPPPPPPPVTDLAQVLGVGVVPGNAQLVVTWTAVSTATGYTVQWMSSGQGYNTGDRQATVTTGSTTRYTIPSLTNGTEYTVRVIATRTGATTARRRRR